MNHLPFAVVAALATAVACSSSEPRNVSPEGGVPDGGPTGTGGSANTGGRPGTGGSGTPTCEQLGFKASGRTCSTGCGFSCSCPDGFPKSIAHCTGADGCLISANCEALCKMDLGRALDCTDTYAVEPAGTGGSGNGGSGGSTSGTGGVAPTCSASDVHIPASSAVELGNIPLTYPRMIGDESGAVYIAATVGGDTELDVGGDALPKGTHLTLFKLDAAHQHVWSRRFGSELGIERVTSFRFARNGDLLLAGFTGRKVNLGGGATPETVPPQLFVARYGRDGTFVRGYLAPGAETGDVVSPSSVVEMASGEILVFGSFAKPWNIGGATLTPAGENDVFILRFAAGGALTDAKRFGRNRNDLVFDAVADDGGVYVLGFAYVAIDFGKDAIDLGTDQSSSYVVRLDAALSPTWQKRIGGVSAYPRRALLDGASLVVAGDTYSEVWYGDASAGKLPRGHSFLLRLDTASGSMLQGRTFADTGFGAHVTALGLMPSGGVAIGGYVQAPADFGGGPLTSIPGQHPFLAQFDGDGAHVLSTLFCTSRVAGGADGAIGGIARDADSTILIGAFEHDMELGSVRFTDGYGSLLVDMPP